MLPALFPTSPSCIFSIMISSLPLHVVSSTVGSVCRYNHITPFQYIFFPALHYNLTYSTPLINNRISMSTLSTQTFWSCGRGNFCTRTGTRKCTSQSDDRFWRPWMARIGRRRTDADENSIASIWSMSTGRWVNVGQVCSYSAPSFPQPPSLVRLLNLKLVSFSDLAFSHFFS